MREWVLENFFTILSTLFGSGGIYAYFVERKKRKVEVKQNTADALKTMQDAYDRFTEDSLSRYEGLKNEVNDLKKEVEVLSDKLKDEVSKYKALRRAYDILKLNYDKLKKEFEEYKKRFNEQGFDTHS